jgi:hypothetical protein
MPFETFLCPLDSHRDSLIHFGDMLEDDIIGRAEENAKKCDLILALGT